MKFTKDDIAKLPPHIRCQIEAAFKSDAKKKLKHGNTITQYDGIKFRSIRECNRYKVLKYHESLNIIKDLKLQVRYNLMVNDKLIESYDADFVYTDVQTGQQIVEDCKGFRTETYKRKRKWMKKIHGIVIKET